MFSSGPPELPGLIAGVRLDEVLELPAGARLDGPVLGRNNPRSDGLRQREGLPMASTESPTSVASELPIFTVAAASWCRS